MTIEIKLVLEDKEELEALREHLDECFQYHWGKSDLMIGWIEQLDKNLEELK